MKKTWYGLLLCLLPLMAAADWDLEKDKDGIRVYTQAVKTSAIRRFKVEMTLPVTLDRVLAVFDDFKRYPEWKFKVNRSGVLAQPDESSWYHYQDLSMPFPLEDRMFVMRSRLLPQGRNKVVIETRATPEYCRKRQQKICAAINRFDGLLVQEAQGRHELEQLANGSTRITWIQHAEPGGSLPDWLVNALLVDGPWETFKGLRAYVDQPRYREARLKRDASGVLLGGFEKVTW
ncbi:START domain-containing protein [Thiolapillus brandeum]|uniref:START domain-containing protein n=1 Tax=Thiolapillus brandeum TaxID=1076588 RepID=UPI00155AA193|nr:START domain-containing protein [Thiolapillus brandeum]